jgi:thiamine kinase-like enzyme
MCVRYGKYMKYSIKSVIRFLDNKAIVLCLRKYEFWRWRIVLPLLLKVRGINVQKNRIRNMCIMLNGRVLSQVRLSSTNAITLITENSFLKIPLTESCERRIVFEFDQWKSVIDQFHQIVIPEEKLCTFKDQQYLQMPILSSVPCELTECCCMQIMKVLYSERKWVKGYITDDVINGFSILSCIVEKREFDIFKEEVKKRWNEINICLTPVHGDFHPGNVMFYEGRGVLIDMDRYSNSGICIFDLIHYRLANSNQYLYWMDGLKGLSVKDIEKICLAETAEIIGDLSEREWDIVKMMYWIDRIGKENKYEIILTTALINNIRLMFQYIFSLLEG